MTFRSGGNRFVCNMCTFPNEVPTEYFSPTNPQGVRVDREQRLELTRGTVEFMVPKEYWAKDPVGLHWLFLIDVGQEAFNRGFLEAFCEGIVAALYGDGSSPSDDSEEGEGARRLPPGSRVGIVTYDKDIHFYNLSAGLEKAQMMVMPDIEEPFVPLSDGLFVDPYESKDVITSLLTQIPALFSTVKHPEPALLPTLNAALAALTTTGGKIVCSLSALPTWGPGRLFLRDDGKIRDTESERKLFSTEHPGWKKTAEKMVQSGVGVDFFLAAAGGGYLDIATVGHVSAATGGETFYYPNFHSPRDILKLSKEIKHTVGRQTGYQALMKVRCSNGLQVSSYHGNFVQHTFGADLEFGVIDSDKAIGVIFSYDGKLDAKLDAHFQSALLYTTASGERRVRCCNVVASVSEGGREGMRFVDQDAVVNLIAKESATRMTERTLKEIRGALSEKTVDILAGYRKNFSGSHPPGQLVLPEHLKEFGMFTLGLLKSRAFKGGHEPTDRRTHEMRMIKSMGAMELSLYLYPRIIPVHNLSEQDGFPNANGHLQVPPAIRASFSRVEEGGAYLVDNGQVCLLWIHAQVSPNLLVDLFGDSYTTLQSLDPFTSSLPTLETHLNAQVRNILQYLSTIRGSKALTIQLARQGLDGAEYEFARLLVEDRNNEAQSYVDWLVHVHRHIQLELSGQRKKDEGGESSVSNLASLRPPFW
ncbi:MAG: COPII coat Sec23p-Sfb3p heterodimer component [Thelocarpon impressellum]|nr:MAG: COPII coat Sec23p-Sfb3p heterodimer component [Thelocarpon impressellum]